MRRLICHETVRFAMDLRSSMIRAAVMTEWACMPAWRIRLEKNETLPNRMIREGFYVFSTGSGVRALAVVGGLLTTILALTSTHAHDWTPFQ